MDFNDREKIELNDGIPQNSSSGASTPVSHAERREWDDADDVEKSMSKDGRDGHLSRTKSAMSIADTLSLPREIAFVGVICMCCPMPIFRRRC